MHSPVSTTAPTREERASDGEAPREPSSEASAEELLSVLTELDQEDPLAVRLRERVMAHYGPLLNRIAHRYRGRGEDVEDLRQTAHLGLAKAIRGYVPERGRAFISYLLPTVTGEIKRHFRDHTWAVHTPRDPQSRRPRMRRARGELEQRLARTPSNAEIAREMGLEVEDVEEILLVSEAYNTLSLDGPEPHGQDTSVSWHRYLGVEDHELGLVVDRVSACSALRRLPARERHILKRRFFDEWKQEHIAEEVGCSQMHVSRLLSGALNRLRRELTEEDPPPAGRPGRPRV